MARHPHSVLQIPRRLKSATGIIWMCGGLILLTGILSLLFGFESHSSVSVNKLKDHGKFLAIYEPSGIQQLADGRLIAIEDESKTPFHLLTPNEQLIFKSKPIRSSSIADILINGKKLLRFDDLEGVSADHQGFVYTITSHSRTVSGKRRKTREKLIRFRIVDDEIKDLQVVTSLHDAITEASRKLKKASGLDGGKDGKTLNIEALSFNKSGEKLLIGLRSPVLSGQGVILILENPHHIFDQGVKPKIAEEFIKLDLAQGGLRTLSFDSKLDGYLIISQREDKKRKPFKFWFWDGNIASKPRPVNIHGVDNINRAEGITPFLQNGEHKLLIVYDDGNALRRIGAHYQIIDYSQLQIGDTTGKKSS